MIFKDDIIWARRAQRKTEDEFPSAWKRGSRIWEDDDGLRLGLVCSGGDSQQNYEFQVLTLLSGVQSTHVVPKLEHLENLLPVLLRPYCSKNR